MDLPQPSTERRRSERVSESLPLIVRGIDLLGQPFEERTSTLAFNLHGCRYTSKHHLPKNTWVTIELPMSTRRRNVRARVAWIQRPHSIREFFQVAIELETPSDLWGLASPPTGWAADGGASVAALAGAASTEIEGTGAHRGVPAPTTLSEFMGKLMTDMTKATESPNAESVSPFVFTPATESPLLRELRAELERQAVKAVETASAEAREKIRQTEEEFEQRRSATSEEILQRWKDDFERMQTAAGENFSAQLSAKQEEFFSGLKAQFEEDFRRARELAAEIDRRAATLRSENEAAQESVSRVAQARLQLEAAEAARSAKPPEISKEDLLSEMAAEWRHRLRNEMELAQGQWNELLQSSLDANLKRMIEQISERSREILHEAGQKISERLAELRQPVAEISNEAHEAVAGIRAALHEELAQARTSLEGMEQSAARIRESSAQFEAASHDALNGLHRRLEAMVDAQTAELGRRAEGLSAGLAERVAPSLDALGRQMVERTLAEAESRLGPVLEKAQELLRDLGVREVQVEDSLRLHRERLRQVSENNQREAAAQMFATLIDLRTDFESARKEALAKWNEELESSSARVSHSASESLGRTSEWFQQEARARMQVLTEQTLAASTSALDERAAEAAKKFEAQLSGQAAHQLNQIEQRAEGIASGVADRARTQIDAAAEAAAASFGQVLRRLSETEEENFGTRARMTIEENSRELDRSARQVIQSMERNMEATMEQFQPRMAAELESLILTGRMKLAAEFDSSLENYSREREGREKEWLAGLDRLSGEASGKFQDRLETSADSWLMSSVRRLNEHGQNAIETLMRSADQALRESFSKVFDGLAVTMRERTVNAAGVPAFVPPSRESVEPPAPRNEATPR
ncbi:MAG TPA: hypothetical protein VEU52_00145 [Candidatus Limnocylindrales bacterium]|nr:hypothetical protein [Candidatus Limnocylindrales bacterium]